MTRWWASILVAALLGVGIAFVGVIVLARFGVIS